MTDDIRHPDTTLLSSHDNTDLGSKFQDTLDA